MARSAPAALTWRTQSGEVAGRTGLDVGQPVGLGRTGGVGIEGCRVAAEELKCSPLIEVEQLAGLGLGPGKPSPGRLISEICRCASDNGGFS